jgi:hypothetical protein
LFKWEGYSHDENMWETYENVLEHSIDLLKDYYGKNSTVERDGRCNKMKCKKILFFSMIIIIYYLELFL